MKAAKLPWGWYILNLVISIGLVTIMVKLPQVAGEIMAGKIFDKRLVFTYILVTIGASVIMLPTSILIAWINLQTDKRLRKTIWKKIIHLPLAETDKVAPTSLVSRVTTDTATLSYGIMCFFNLINTSYGLILILIAIGKINSKMLLMLLILVPFILLATIPSHFMHDVQNQAQGALAHYTNFLAERLSSLHQIKAFTAEEKEDMLNNAASKDYFKANIKRAKLDVIAQPLIYSMDAVTQAVVLIYGGYLLSRGELQTSSIITLFMYSATIFGSASQFVFFWQSLKTAQGATKVSSEIVITESEQMERQQSFAIPDENIRLENVSFAYENGKKVLDNLIMEIPKGKTTVILGPSGSGKSTVLKLLERLYQPTSGKIMFGSIPAEDIHLNEWRDSFGIVPQDSPLLFGTIRDNITYGLNEEVSEEILQNAITRANVKEIIEHLPEGLYSDVGDVGMKLSGGEKQRIALARMVIRDPEYLLMDEATSNLDGKNEKLVSEALLDLMKGKTSVIVTHKLRAVELADNIIFMEDGKVKGCGTHEDMYEKNDTYRRYVDLQRC